MSDIKHSMNKFAASLYSVLSNSVENGENVFFSPASIFAALSMTYCGARGNTANQMKTVMSLDGNPEDEKLHAAISEVCLVLLFLAQTKFNLFYV